MIYGIPKQKVDPALRKAITRLNTDVRRRDRLAQRIRRGTYDRVRAKAVSTPIRKKRQASVQASGQPGGDLRALAGQANKPVNEDQT